MSRWTLFLILSWTPQFALSQQSSPLQDTEKRAVLRQLYELESCRETVAAYEGFVARDKEQDDRERANSARALELERQATALAQRETAIEKSRADFYEAAFKSVTRGPSTWCRVKEVLTLGLTRCR